MKRDEKIKEAYGEHWNKVKDNISHDGWVNSISLIPYFEVAEIDFINRKQRLLSLRGIENNNGWTKIDNVTDLPEFGYYEVVLRKNGSQERATLNNKLGAEICVLNYSHYRKIIKFDNPIY